MSIINHSSKSIPKAPFKPSWWLKNKHLQTLIPVLYQKSNIILIREKFILSDGDFLFLDWTNNKTVNQPVLILLHGLEGSSSSHYIKRMMKKAVQNNLRCVCMNFRSCVDNGDGILLKSGYHAGKTKDFEEVLHYIINQVNLDTPIYVVGYSLGANILLKWLGENSLFPRITAAVAVSVPFDLSLLVKKLNKGFSRFYQWWLLKSLKNNRIHKFINKSLFDSNKVLKINNFKEYDDKVTAPLYGFLDAEDYYTQSSCKAYLPNIKNKVLIIHAKDDPFLPAEAIVNLDEVSNTIELEIFANGGHVGFIEGNIPFYPKYYLEKRIIEYLL